MDSMSYRNNRPAPQRPEPEKKTVQTPPPAAEPAATIAPARTKRTQNERSRRPKKLVSVVAIIIAVVAIGLAVFFLIGKTGVNAAIDGGKYQAVFFTNGQVYFGKLSTLNGEYMRLENVYYLQNKEKTTDETSPQSATKQNASDVELVKLGGEIHGPEDEMVIAKDQILFFENLKPAGTVSETITNFQKKN